MSVWQSVSRTTKNTTQNLSTSPMTATGCVAYLKVPVTITIPKKQWKTGKSMECSWFVFKPPNEKTPITVRLSRVSLSLHTNAHIDTRTRMRAYADTHAHVISGPNNSAQIWCTLFDWMDWKSLQSNSMCVGLCACPLLNISAGSSELTVITNWSNENQLRNISEIVIRQFEPTTLICTPRIIHHVGNASGWDFDRSEVIEQTKRW